MALKGRMIAMPILKPPLSVRRPFLKGNVTIEGIELDALTLDAGEEYKVIITSRDDTQLVCRGGYAVSGTSARSR